MTDAHANTELLELQETLYNSSNPTRKWLHCVRREWVEASLRTLSKDFSSSDAGKISNAIEVGPGSGIYLPLLCELADDVTAADIETAYLEKAESLRESFPNLRCAQSDITASTLPEGNFDLILCSEVIEHVSDSPALLRGLARLLAPGGRLVLSTPQRYSPLELCAKIAFLPGIIDVVRKVYAEPIIPTGHINLLTEAEFKRQLDSSGLHVLEQYKCGFYLPLIAEFFGQTGQRLLAFLGNMLRDGPLDGLLWTQCYIIAASDKEQQPPTAQ